ncbi:MAG TPA: TonB-dependent receptor, partial [Bacteroidales bacterium]|nr:TonB-dependent receptor [Bacteroidales bacterium]
FNGDALKSVELTKGGFPARYGGRLSSVIDMNMKEGNKEAWHGEGGIGLISSRLTLEGPLKKDKSSILLSGRRTYVDFITRPITKSNSNGNFGYYFYDMNAKVNYDFGRKNKLYLSAYFGKDLCSIKSKDREREEKAGFNWGNYTTTLRWNHLFHQKLFSNTSLIYSRYNFQINDRYKLLKENESYYTEYNSGIEDYTFKYDLDFIPETKHWFKAGILATLHEFKPYAFAKKDEETSEKKSKRERYEGTELGAYIEDTYQPIDILKINAGIRYSLFLTGQKLYSFIEPRISVATRVADDVAIKASYANMNQFIHLISYTGISLPTDLWVPSSDKVHPQTSSQIALGIAKDFAHPLLTLSLEGYYKKMDHIIGYKEGATYIEIGDANTASKASWEKNITPGQGWSYGVEFLIQKKTGRFNGWVGYTLSWTRFQFDSLNQGRKFYARYDRRHDVSVVGIYKLSERISLSGTWVYGSGNAVTLPEYTYNSYSHVPLNYNSFFDERGYKFFDQVEGMGTKNNYRMSAYHRFDFGIQFHKKKRWGERVWEISVYNVYNRKNPFFYFIDEDYETKTKKMTQVSLFPVIPSITYSFKF